MLKLNDILDKQSCLFESGKTKDYKFRLKQLHILKLLVKENEDKILKALKADLNKSSLESYMCEIGLVYAELDEQISKLRKNMKPIKVKTPLMLFKSKSSYVFEPYGQVLIIGPFNYPIQLVLIPLIGAVASGNTVVLKPSEQSFACSNLLMELLNKTFSSDYIHVVDVNLSQEKLNSVLDYKYDLIFFTGSSRVAKIVMAKAALNLTPIILELGGKSPTVIDKSADLKMSAKRVIWGKITNAGQTCIAPDYLFVHEDIKDDFINLLKIEIDKQFNSEQYPQIINEKTVERLASYLNDGTVIKGGNYDVAKRYFEMTLMLVDDINTKLMNEEIFGPILPILTYANSKELYEYLNKQEKPLVLYCFSNDKKQVSDLIKKTFSGDVVINDVLIHASNPNLPFGGVGNSGMGSYHGVHSFQAFCYKRSILKRSNIIEFPFRFMPYNKKNENIIKRLLK